MRCAEVRWVPLGTAGSQPHQVCGFFLGFGAPEALPKGFAKALRNAHFGARLCTFLANAPRETLFLEHPKHQHHHFARAVVLKGLRSRQPVKLPLAGFSAPPLVPTGARELHEKSEPQPGGSNFFSAPPLASGASLAVGFAAFWDLFGRLGGSRSAPGVRLTRPGSQAEKVAFWGVPGALPIGLAIACVGVGAGVSVGCRFSASRV